MPVFASVVNVVGFDIVKQLVHIAVFVVLIAIIVTFIDIVAIVDVLVLVSYSKLACWRCFFLFEVLGVITGTVVDFEICDSLF